MAFFLIISFKNSSSLLTSVSLLICHTSKQILLSLSSVYVLSVAFGNWSWWFVFIVVKVSTLYVKLFISYLIIVSSLMACF